MKHLAIFFIKIYQKIPGPWHNMCKFTPTCSNYAIESYQTYGFFKGTYLTIKRLLKCGYGTCWDQVELERDWFINNDYECKTFFIWFCFSTSNNYVTHTYLVYKDKKTEKYCYFEHSDGANKGIKEFDSYKDAILYQMEKYIDFNRSVGNLINEDILSHLQVYEFEIKKYGCSQYEYMENILNSKLVYDNNKFVTEINVCKSKN